MLQEHISENITNMAKRPIYVASNGALEVTKKDIEFQWFPGFSVSQKQKSIKSLHDKAEKSGITPILEISSKSPNDLGVSLSAFNLMITTKKSKKSFSVESAFQGSKVFKDGGPYTDLYLRSSREAKKDTRLKTSGNLIEFSYFSRVFPLNPRTYFYDWLYINALNLNQDLTTDLINYSGFTDIEFNPSKSINCQAFSAALFVILVRNNVLDQALESPISFLETLSNVYSKTSSYSTIQTPLL